MRDVNLMVDRGFNLTLNPVIRNNRKIEFPYDFQPDYPLVVSQEWNAESFKILDVISDIIYRSIYPIGDERPKTSNSSMVYDTLVITRDNINYKINERPPCNNGLMTEVFPMKFTFTEKELYINYPFLRKYKSEQLSNLFKKTSECKFKGVFNVRVKNSTDRRKKKYALVTCSIDSFESIFDIEIDKNIKNKEYTLEVSSKLGHIFVQDIKTLNMDYMNSSFYTLPEYAQCLYRRLFMKRNKGTRFDVELDDLKTFLTLKSSGWDLQSIIDKQFNILQDVGLIEWEKQKVNPWVIYQLCKSKSRPIVEPPSTPATVHQLAVVIETESVETK